MFKIQKKPIDHNLGRPLELPETLVGLLTKMKADAEEEMRARVAEIDAALQARVQDLLAGYLSSIQKPDCHYVLSEGFNIIEYDNDK